MKDEEASLRFRSRVGHNPQNYPVIVRILRFQYPWLQQKKSRSPKDSQGTDRAPQIGVAAMITWNNQQNRRNPGHHQETNLLPTSIFRGPQFSHVTVGSYGGPRRGIRGQSRNGWFGRSKKKTVDISPFTTHPCMIYPDIYPTFTIKIKPNVSKCKVNIPYMDGIGKGDGCTIQPFSK